MVEGFECTNDPRRKTVKGFMFLVGSPKAKWSQTLLTLIATKGNSVSCPEEGHWGPALKPAMEIRLADKHLVAEISPMGKALRG